MQTAKIIKFLTLKFHIPEIKVLSKEVTGKTAIIILESNLQINLDWFFPDDSKWSFSINLIFVGISVCIPKIGFQSFEELTILNKEFFFICHIEYLFLKSSEL